MAKKAINRKKRLKSKAGRPRRENVRRTRAGRISESKKQGLENQKQIKETVVQTRIRLAALNGEVIDEKQAEDPRRGYIAGQKFLNGDLGMGELGEQRLEVGNDIAATIGRCMGILGYPPPTAQAMDMGRVRGLPIEGLNAAQKAKIAERRLMEIEGILGRAGHHCRTCFRQVFLLEEENSHLWKAHQNRILIKALDALIEEGEL